VAIIIDEQYQRNDSPWQRSSSLYADGVDFVIVGIIFKNRNYF